METYGRILNMAMPAFLVLVLIEKAYGWYVKKDAFKPMDTLASMSSGYTNVVKDVLGLSISIITYRWMVENWALFEIKSTVWMAIVAFLVLDFAGYWGHRLSHGINFLWNQHLVHHSSEEFNLACALRQSISNILNVFTIFLLPAALLGIPTETIAIIAPIHLFAQFWYHTVYIGRLGFLEHIIVTPSHHRVHHAINPQYLDKNHGQIFIIWDKLFGTFQEELPNEPPVYGITRPVQTHNPIKINFTHLWLLITDAYRARHWQDKLKIWFMPTGWRPADVAARFPVHKIDDVYRFEKFAPAASPALVTWVWVQFMATFWLMVYLFSNITAIGSPNMFFYGGFIWLTVYSYTQLMDGSPDALFWEILKNSVGLGLLYFLGGWFGIGTILPWANAAIAAYFVVSSAVTFYFYAQKKQVTLQAERLEV